MKLKKKVPGRAGFTWTPPILGRAGYMPDHSLTLGQLLLSSHLLTPLKPESITEWERRTFECNLEAASLECWNFAMGELSLADGIVRVLKGKTMHDMEKKKGERKLF